MLLLQLGKDLFSDADRKVLLEAYEDGGMNSTTRQTLTKRRELAENLGCQLKNIDVRLARVIEFVLIISFPPMHLSFSLSVKHSHI